MVGRHGETETNVRVYIAATPTPLTERGIAGANAGALLGDVAFDNRSVQRAGAHPPYNAVKLGDREIPVRNMPELNEMFFGDWEMRHHRDLRARRPKTTPCGVTTGRTRRPLMAKVFRHFPARGTLHCSTR
ncbi:histidine phosphatase family protein [Shigella flexneri]